MEEKGKVKRIEDIFLRWMLEVDWRTPECMIRKEMHRDKLRGKAARRAWNFEKRLEEKKRGRD